MNEDSRCCGSGTCIIDIEGRCWCGQQWDGEAMRFTSAGNTCPPTVHVPPVEDEEAD